MRLVLMIATLFTLPAALLAAPSAPPDTVLVADLIVLGDAVGGADPADVTLSADALTAVAPWNAGDLEALLPATTINVNSRGESLLMVRGAPERHVTVSLDGIPLTVPWDERADLSLVPLDGVTSLQAVRGASSLLHGPNGVAGSLDLRTSGSAPRAAVSFLSADGGDFAARATLRSHRGDWQWLAATSFRKRDALILPDEIDAPFHQSDPDKRTNTDLRQVSALLRGVHELDHGGRLSVLLLASDAERGIAPETHLDDGARLWRLPLVRRGLAGVRYESPLGSDWSLDAAAALDMFAQDIRPYTTDAYDDPELVADDELEQGRDLTGHLRLGMRRNLAGLSHLNLLIQGRTSRHRERLIVDGPSTDYSQLLTSSVAELNIIPDAPWTLRLGVGIDAAATPSSGHNPRHDAMTSPSLLTRFTHDVGSAAQIHIAASRRSRFPALRELYSGALGRFVPNPELDPEHQTLLEAGFASRGMGWEASLTTFAARLDDGIEKSSLESGQFMRVNRWRIHTRGIELVVSRRLTNSLTIGVHHSLLHARVDDGADTSQRPAEDRPSYQGSMLAEWRTPAGWHLSLVGSWLGRRTSADVTDTVDGMMDLDSEAWWDAWLGKSFKRGVGGELEVRIGVRNIGDAVIWEQAGLPGAGRTITGNIQLSLF